MRRLMTVVLTVAAVGGLRVATAGAVVDGGVVSHYGSDGVFTGILQQSKVGYLQTPRVGEIYYMHVVAYTSTPAGGSVSGRFDVVLPSGSSVYVTQTTPVQCFVTNSGVSYDVTSGAECPRHPGAGTYGYDFGARAIPGSSVFEIRFPVLSTQQVTQNAVLRSTCFECTTDTQVLYANVSVPIGGNPPSVAYPNPPTTALTDTSATGNGIVYNHYQAGDAYFGIGTAAGAYNTWTYYGPIHIGADANAYTAYNTFPGLAPSTTYHWHLVFGIDATHSWYGSDQTFVTKAAGTPDDVTPPTVTAPVVVLQQGAQLSSSGVPLRVTWSGHDAVTPAASLRYELGQRTAGSRDSLGAWSIVRNFATGTATTRVLRPSWLQFQVRARDAASNVSSAVPSLKRRLVTYQENAVKPGTTTPAIAYSGSWSRVSRTGAYGGYVRTTTAAGAKASLTVSGVRGIGVVLPRRSDLGSVRVCLDPGTAAQSCRDIDLSPASGLQPRLQLWARNGLATSSHRVVVTRLSGRVDLDAFTLLT